MVRLQGLTKVCAQILVSASLVWTAACADAPQQAQDEANVAVQSAALTTGGTSGGGIPAAPPDEIIGPFSKDLNGISLVYHYTHDGDYYITYGKDTVTFKLPLPDGTHTPPITVPYFVRKLRGDMYMIHWINPEKTVHVTQVLDLAHKEVNVAALMPGQWQLFDVGQITEIKKPRK